MCGRYNLNVTPSELRNHFDGLVPGVSWDQMGFVRSYNVAPSGSLPVIRHNKSTGSPDVDSITWGFRPGWAKRAWINARAETLFEAAAFKDAARKRRCLVIAKGWYEWQAVPGSKQGVPYYVHFDRVFAFAGVWTARQTPDGWIRSFAIVTTAAGPMLEAIHDRMPLVMHPRHYAAWIDPRTERPADLLVPFNDGTLRTYRVSTFVNNPKNDGDRCVEPA